MYEQHKTLGGNASTAGAAGGTLGGYASQVSAPISKAPIDQAIESMEKEIGILWEEASMLVGRLQPISKSLSKPAGESHPEAPEYCEHEAKLNASKRRIAEIRSLVSSARDALCI